MKNTPKKEKMYVKIDYDTITKIQKLGFMNETIPEFIEKMVEHVLTCDIWWLEQDLENQL